MTNDETTYRLLPEKSGSNPAVLVTHGASGIAVISEETHSIIRNRQIAIAEIEKLLDRTKLLEKPKSSKKTIRRKKAA
jgi:protein subunit release factor A